MSSPSLPAALAAFARRRALGTQQWETRGQLELRVDARTRVKARPGRRASHVLLEARVSPLPSSPREREDLLARTMLHVTAGAASQVGVIALSPDGEQILLQGELDGDDAGRFDADLEAFLNEVDYWSAVLRRPARP
jgi:hypothetical protein